MTERTDRKKTAGIIYLAGIILLVAAMPLSVFMMSLAQIILLAGWLLHGDLKNKFKSFFSNKPALVVSGIYLMHVIGLIYSSDFNYAFNDLRIKLPLLLLPLLFSTGPKITARQVHLILSVFVVAVLSGTFISMMVVTGVINYSISDIRDISIFISHIRFSLLICLAIFVVVYLNNYYKSNLVIILSILLIFWFCVFLFILESITGLLVLSFTGFVFLIIYLFKRPYTASTVIAAVLLLMLPFSGYLYINKLYKKASYFPEHQLANLPEFTPSGNPYEHHVEKRDLENGNIVWININWDEMRDEWNNRSNLNFDSLDLKGQHLKTTLVRFMSSKGLTKDKEGIQALSDKEIKSVEKGITNVDDQEITNIHTRVAEIFWEYETYKLYGNPGGHSVMQRVEFWKGSLYILKNNILKGVGTGDVNNEFKNYYVETNSVLEEKWRLRSHNQYLSIAVAFGLPGLLYFIFALIYPAYKLKKFNSFLYLSFFITAVLSMIPEDTLETQAGVTFFAFFNCFYLFILPDNGKAAYISPQQISR